MFVAVPCVGAVGAPKQVFFSKVNLAFNAKHTYAERSKRHGSNVIPTGKYYTIALRSAVGTKELDPLSMFYVSCLRAPAVFMGKKTNVPVMPPVDHEKQAKYVQ